MMKKVLVVISVIFIFICLLVFNNKNAKVKLLPILGEYAVNEAKDTLYYKVKVPKLVTSQINSIDLNQQDVSIVSFFFTKCPSICPVTNHNLKKVAIAFQNNTNVFINSISIDSTNDTKEVLERYKQLHEINSENWVFYTGEKSNIFEFARNCKIKAFEENPKNELVHEPILVLLDEQKHIRGYYNSLQQKDIDKLIGDTKKLIKEQS